MHWILDSRLQRTDAQGNSANELGYDQLLKALDRTETPYTRVKVAPFSDTGMMIPHDWDTFRKEEPPEVTVDVEGPVFICGTLTMRMTAARNNWSPGYIDAPGQVELIEAWGDHMLNADARIGPFATTEPPCSQFFARPVEDNKSFAGTVYLSDSLHTSDGDGREQYLDWREQVMKGQDAYTTIRGDDLVVLAPLKNIYAEYRLYAVAGRIVTGSRYKLGNRVFSTTDLPPDMLDYARARLDEYCPRRALCLDIAHIEGPEPFKVIETNSISSAGFYACDMNIFVNEMNAEFDG